MNPDSEMSNVWLVRTHKNEIFGPVGKEELLALIRDRKLTPEDEVCSGNNYWIHLDERDEVNRQLGIEMPRAARDPDEEITLTETVEIAPTVPTAPGAPRAPEVPRPAPSHLTAAPPSEISAPQGPIVVGRAEKMGFWRLIAIAGLFILLSAGLVGWILKILQSSH